VSLIPCHFVRFTSDEYPVLQGLQTQSGPAFTAESAPHPDIRGVGGVHFDESHNNEPLRPEEDLLLFLRCSPALGRREPLLIMERRVREAPVK
jgi:hypothetical protein